MIFDKILDQMVPGMSEKVALGRWFGSRSGQHEPREGSRDNQDLVRMRSGPAGLPTIRADLGDRAWDIRLSTIDKKGVRLLDHVLGRMSVVQREQLRRLA